MVRTALLFLVALVFVACSSEPVAEEYVARVGDHYLTEADLQQALESLPPGRDTDEARDQVIEQWVHNTLLYEEALQRNLQEEPDIQRQLEDSERSLLVSSMMAALEDEVPAPSQEELQSYFDQHQERLRLREPYVHVRYVRTATREEAEEARSQLQADYNDEVADSTYPRILDEYASDRDLSAHFDETYYPERIVREQLPYLSEEIGQLSDGDITTITEIDGQFAFLQLVQREAAGSDPQFSWVEDEIRRILEVESRKQTLARKVQELRNEALAREELDVR